MELFEDMYTLGYTLFMKSIYEYLDYRRFMSDFFSEKRKESSHFSLRFVERKIGLDASNLHKILSGKRHVNHKYFDAFVSLLKLNEDETGYFRELITFARARSEKNRHKLLKQLVKYNPTKMNLIKTDRYEFYQHWYYTAVLALLYFYPVRKGLWKRIATNIHPQISEKQARESIALLERLNFIVLDKKGYYVHTDSIITTGEQWFSIAVNTFQRETLELALQSLLNDPVEERSISTLTVTLNSDGYERVKKLSAEFRQSVLREVSQSDETPERVYQINTQIFPLSVARNEQ